MTVPYTSIIAVNGGFDCHRDAAVMSLQYTDELSIPRSGQKVLLGKFLTQNISVPGQEDGGVTLTCFRELALAIDSDVPTYYKSENSECVCAHTCTLYITCPTHIAGMLRPFETIWRVCNCRG